MFDVPLDSPGSLPPGRALGRRLQEIDREMRRLEAEAVATIAMAEQTGAYAEGCGAESGAGAGGVESALREAVG